MSPGRYRRTVCAVLAIAVAFGLLHAPSMMLGSAVATGIDCHGAMSNSSASHSMHDHQAPDELQLPDDVSGKIKLASNCPLANLTGIAAAASDLAIEGRASDLEMAAPSKLIAAPPDLADPPPRNHS